MTIRQAGGLRSEHFRFIQAPSSIRWTLIPRLYSISWTVGGNRYGWFRLQSVQAPWPSTMRSLIRLKRWPLRPPPQIRLGGPGTYRRARPGRPAPSASAGRKSKTQPLRHPAMSNRGSTREARTPGQLAGGFLFTASPLSTLMTAAQAKNIRASTCRRLEKRGNPLFAVKRSGKCSTPISR